MLIFLLKPTWPILVSHLMPQISICSLVLETDWEIEVTYMKQNLPTKGT